MRDLGVKWGISEEKMCDFGDNGVFLERKCMILGKMRIFQEKMPHFRVKWGTLEEKLHFLLVKWGIFEEKMLDFRLQVRFLLRKCVIFWIHGGFL